MQADWSTNDYTAQSYIKNRPPLTYVPDISKSTITGNMACTSNISCSSNVSALQFFGSGAGLTNSNVLSGAWVNNGTNTFIQAGSNVGIGSSSPTAALDVSGGVKVSGGVTAGSITTGNAATKTFLVTGTMPGTVSAIISNINLPSNCVAANIVSIIFKWTGCNWPPLHSQGC